MILVGELAEKLGLEFSGDSTRPVTGVATLIAAQSTDLSFLSDIKYLSQLADTRAAVVILTPDLVEQCPTACLISEKPYLSYARASRFFVDAPTQDPGVHSSAVVSGDAEIHPTASIGPNVVIESGVRIGANCVIATGVHVGFHAELFFKYITHRRAQRSRLGAEWLA